MLINFAHVKVVTLDNDSLHEAFRTLAHSIAELRPEGFDLLVGIRRGGSFVADGVSALLPEGYPRPLRADITLQRADTGLKSRFAAPLLHLLPRPVLDWLRIAEARVRSFMPRKVPGIRRQATACAILPQLPPRSRILVIDDAIDSGSTMLSVLTALKSRYTDPAVTVAAITVTTCSPAVDADIFIHHDGTLVRFPWSEDYPSVRSSRR